MLVKLILVLILLQFPSMAAAAEADAVAMIPKPVSMDIAGGHYVLPRNIRVYADEPVAGVSGKQLIAQLRKVGLQAKPHSRPGTADIRLIIDEQMAADSHEAYKLSVNRRGILIAATGPAGIFYGVQSLLQLMPVAIYGDMELTAPIRIPRVEIADSPRFQWRGLMIDLSRHFFDKSVLKKTVDWMAMHKLNRLHLHLTDDPGWRVEIDAYPKLTAIGARGNRSDADAPAQFLSKADIRELVSYAGERYIEVVPEIDMPGHGGAAARAYPEFFDGHVTYNMGKEETYRFVQDVLDEVMDLFPSPYIHFGGDELRNHNLEGRPQVQAFMAEKGLQTIHELERYFDRFVSDYIADRGRVPMGWDEIAGYDIGNNAVVQWWRGRKPEVLDYAVDQGYRVVLSPADHIYLDYPQAVGEPGAPWEGNDNGPNSVELIYNWKMIPDTYTPEQEQQVIGIEAALWTEFIRSENYYEYMMFPRLAAIAEIAWVAGGERDQAAFNRRLQQQYKRYQAMGINYRIPVPGDPLAKNAGRYLTN